MAPARNARTSKARELKRTKPRTSKPNKPERNELVIISIPSDNDDSSDNDGSSQSDSDDDGSLPLTNPLARDATETVYSEDSNGAADAGGRLGAVQPEADNMNDTRAHGRAGGGQGAKGGENAGASESGRIGGNDRPQAGNGGHSVPSRRGTTHQRRPDEILNSEQKSDNASTDATRPNKVSTLQRVRLTARTATTALTNGNRTAMGGDATTQSQRHNTIYPFNQDARRDSQAFETAVGRLSTEAEQRTDSRKRRVDVAFSESRSNHTEHDSPSLRSTTGASGPHKRYRNETDETSKATKEMEVPTNEGSTAATTSSRFLLSNANIRMITPERDGSMTVEIDGHWSISLIDMPVPCRRNGDPSTIWVLSVRQLHGDVTYSCEGFLGIHARAPQAVVEIP
ncbi:hypothetical protein ISF_09851 [Cordyceps fumosorosea ARSEF 2679]|uniref:Uncharacterized protein n=1 Tax=Cordyceps fumosorosea (strain ARSEF 2679) TaxID=1081104 RepID=A0A167AZ28_CORFA|nr:hypothetical protein ISF_09851 [Cordyceps fumosorosea ARSEF 2679]OAA39476.1 hypothetical protein ISF_09851 [Cordyceps fumosorosea ARSEF 2679]